MVLSSLPVTPKETAEAGGEHERCPSTDGPISLQSSQPLPQAVALSSPHGLAFHMRFQPLASPFPLHSAHRA